MQKTIKIPITVISKISRATKAFEELEDELEDLLLSKDSEFLKKCARLKKHTLPVKSDLSMRSKKSYVSDRYDS